MSRSLPEVLLVSRPVAPGGVDGTVALVRALAGTGADPDGPVRYRLLTAWGAPSPVAGVSTHPTALPGGAAWRPLTLLYLLRVPGNVIRHWFFTPTPRVVALVRAIQLLRPALAVQTLCSTPDDQVALRPLIFARHVVALSRHTRDRLLAEGHPPHTVHWIPPAVPLPSLPDEALRAAVRRRLGLSPRTKLLAYLGDYDVAGTAELTARGVGPLLGSHDAALVLACRPKGARHREVELSVRGALSAAGAPADRVRLLGRISFAPELAAAADLAIFPARRLPDKMDLPLALLESLAAGVPAVVADEGPLVDLVRAGAALGVPPGSPPLLREAVRRLLEDEPARRALGGAARRHMEREGSVIHMGLAHHALYQLLQGP